MNDPLLREFARNQPAAFAEQLANSHPGDIVDLICQMPPELAAGVLARFASAQLKRIVQRIPARPLGGILCAGSNADAMSIIAHLPASLYPAILEALPPQEQSALSALFNLPEVTVGAQALPEFYRVLPGRTCAELRTELEGDGDLRDLPIFVLDEGSHFLGIVPVLLLLAAANVDRPVTEVMERVTPLNGETSVVSALSYELWKKYPALPVVDGDGRLLGAVSNDNLHRLAAQSESELSFDRSVGGMLAACVSLCGDLVEFIAGEKAL